MLDSHGPSTLRPAVGLLGLDIETTGLEPETHQMWEIGWVLRRPDGTETPTRSLLVSHTLEGAVREALRVGRYLDATEGRDEVPFVEALRRLAADAAGATVVAANPSFDRSFLEPAFRAAGMEVPWHHRAIDVEALTLPLMSAAGFHQPPSLQTCATFLGVAYEPGRHHAAGYDAELALRVYDAALSRYQALGLPVIVAA